MSFRDRTEISMFSGAGGGVLASRLLGLRTLQYVEWDPYCQSVLRQRMADGVIHEAPIHDDAGTFDATPFRDQVDLVHAGFPCFAAGTMIFTASGYTPIETIMVGDYVLTHTGNFRRVTATMVRNHAPTITVRPSGFPLTRCTLEHPFYVQGDDGSLSWMAASDLRRNMQLVEVMPPSHHESGYSPALLWWIGRALVSGETLPRHDGTDQVVVRVLIRPGEDVQGRLEAANLHWCQVVPAADGYQHVMLPRLLPHAESTGAFLRKVPSADAAALLDGCLSWYQDEGMNGHHVVMRTTDLAKALDMVVVIRRATWSVPLVVPDAGQGWVVLLNSDAPADLPDAPVDQEPTYVPRKVGATFGSPPTTVYNLSVDQDESYVANGLVVHNCQAFSVAGKQAAQADERNRWPDTIRVIRECRPKHAFLENVPGLLAGSHGYFGTVLRELVEEGYEVVWSCLPAAAVGAPHRRDRLWALATRLDDPTSRTEVHEPPLIPHARLAPRAETWGTCGWSVQAAVGKAPPFQSTWPRAGAVRLHGDGGATCYVLEALSDSKGLTPHGGWPWPTTLVGTSATMEEPEDDDPLGFISEEAVGTQDSFPTPTVYDATGRGSPRTEQKEGSRHAVSLHHLAAGWRDSAPRTFPTPCASDAEGGAGNGTRQGGVTLRTAVDPRYKGKLLPTPLAGNPDAGSGGNHGGMALLQAAESWPTPRSAGGRHSRAALLNEEGKYHGRAGVGLEQAVELREGILPREYEGVDINTLPPAIQAMWPTPRTKDGKGTDLSRPVGAHGETRHSGDDLVTAVARSSPPRTWPTPMAGPIDPRDGGGAGGVALATEATEAETGTDEGPRGQLNPDWTEWLMGWPVGWTSTEPLDTEHFQTWWDGTLGRSWWLQEPAGIPRIAVDVPNRVGRLKAIGNGQVSLCSASAAEALEEMTRLVDEAFLAVESPELDFGL